MVVPAVIAALVGGILGAWLFMMSAGERQFGRERQ